MTDIATGTVASTTTDRLYIVGAASQIDTYSLVEAGYQTIIADAENIDDKVAENNSIMAAYEELRGIGDSMLGALKLLKQTYGFSSQGDSVYDDLEVYMSSSEGTNVSSVVDVSVEDSADTGTYTLAVEQIATPMRVMSKSMLYKDNPLGYDGVFNLTTENGTPTNITITPDMTLDGLADAINAVKNTTNVSASVIKAGDNDHRLVIAGDVTGEELVYNSISGTNVLQSLFITDAGGPFLPSSIIQNAQDAIINLDGVQVTRSSNTMEDVLDGVSMTVYGETNPGESIKMEVDYDYSAAKEAITAFVDSYNEFRTFYDKHMKLDSSSGSVAEDAVLFSDSILEQLNFQISSVLTSSFGDNDGLV
ncbi:MAG: flagellar filament capping protein FliD, partial [Alphaproteobacteria bacterium]